MVSNLPSSGSGSSSELHMEKGNSTSEFENAAFIFLYILPAALRLRGLTLGGSSHNTDRRLGLPLLGSPLWASYVLSTHDKPGGRICDSDVGG